MLDLFRDIPGRLFVVATLLPLVPVALLCCPGRSATSPGRTAGPAGGRSAYWLLGGDHPAQDRRLPDAGGDARRRPRWRSPASTQYFADAHDPGLSPAQLEARWAERIDWVRIGADRAEQPATALQLGYRIDHLTAVDVRDGHGRRLADLPVLARLHARRGEGPRRGPRGPPAPLTPGPSPQRGEGRTRTSAPRAVRPVLPVPGAVRLLDAQPGDRGQPVPGVRELGAGRRLLVLPDRLLHRAPSASTAANKAFIVNRIGDAGFLVGIAIAWAAFGTLNIQELIGQVRGPASRRGCPRTSGWRWAWGSSSAASASRPRSRCTPGCRTRWKGRRPSPR